MVTWSLGWMYWSLKVMETLNVGESSAVIMNTVTLTRALPVSVLGKVFHRFPSLPDGVIKESIETERTGVDHPGFGPKRVEFDSPFRLNEGFIITAGRPQVPTGE